MLSGRQLGTLLLVWAVVAAAAAAGGTTAAGELTSGSPAAQHEHTGSMG